MTSYLRFVQFRNFSVFKRTDFGPFKPRTFYAIVGPPGVGKTCFLNGLAFVFGERDLGKLRVSATGRLRHEETSSSPPNLTSQEDCWVAAEFCLDNGEKKIFQRKIDSDDSDVFLINNEVVTFDEYVEELSALQIDVKLPHFYVTQGTIGKVALKTAEDITDLFEEVTNSSVLREQYNNLKRDEKKILLNIFQVEEEKRIASECLKQASRNLQFEQLQMEENEVSKELALLTLYHYERIKDEYEMVDVQNEKALDDMKFQIDMMQVELSEKEKNVKKLSDLQLGLKMQLKEVQLNENSATSLARLQTEVKRLFEEQRRDEEQCNILCSKLKKTEKAREISQEKLSNIQHLVQGFPDSSDCTCLEDRNSGQYEAYLELKKRFSSQVAKASAELQSLKLQQTNDSTSREKLDLQRKSLLDQRKASQSRESELRAECKMISDNLQKRRQEMMASEEWKLEMEILKKKEELALITRQLRQVELDDHKFKERKKMDGNLTLLQRSFSQGVVICRLISEGIRSIEISGGLNDPVVDAMDIIMEVLDPYEDSVLVRSNAAAVESGDLMRAASEISETFIPIIECKEAMASRQQEDAGVGTLLPEHVPLEEGFIKETVRFLAKDIAVCQSEEERRAALRSGFDVISPGDIRPQHSTEPDLRARDGAELNDRKKCLVEELADLRSRLAKRPRTSSERSQLHAPEITARSLEDQVKSVTKEITETQERIVEIEEEIRLLDEAMSFRAEQITRMESELASKEEFFFRDFCSDVGVANVQEYDQPCKHCKEEKVKLQLTNEEDILRREIDSLKKVSDPSRRTDTLTLWKDRIKEREERIKEAREAEKDLSKSVEETQQKILELSEQISAYSSELEVMNKDIVTLKGQIYRREAESKKLRKVFTGWKPLELDKYASEAYKYLLIKSAAEGTSEVMDSPQAESTSSAASSQGESTSAAASSQGESNSVEASTGEGNPSTTAGSSEESDSLATQESFQEQNSQAVDIDNPVLTPVPFPEEDELRFDWDACKDASFINFNELKEDLKSFTDVDLIFKLLGELADRKERLKRVLRKMEPQVRTLYQKAKMASLEAEKVLKSWKVKLGKNRKAFRICREERKRLWNSFVDVVGGRVNTWFKALTDCDEAEVFLSTIHPYEPYLGGIAMIPWVPGIIRSDLSRGCLSGGERLTLGFALILSFDTFRRSSIFLADDIDIQTDPSKTGSIALAFVTKAQTSQVFAVCQRKVLMHQAAALIAILKNGSVLYMDTDRDA